MKVTIKLDLDDVDEAIFRKSLMYFLWNNPVTLSVDKIKIGGKEGHAKQDEQSMNDKSEKIIQKGLSYNFFLNC